jgi:hypothetical protein
MFAKVFSQIFDSSIASDYNCRRMFMDLLVLADKHGEVDMTLDAISRRTNVPEDQVRHYIAELCQPDPLSRSQLEEGKRLIPLDPKRDWGWVIVNYQHYRRIRDEEARRSYFREIKRKYRANKKKEVSKKEVQIQSTDTEAEIPHQSTNVHNVSKTEEVTEEEIYQAYPRHDGKDDALKAIRKRIKEGKDPNFLLNRVQTYAKAIAWKERRYIPYPATWFNKGHFFDDESEWDDPSKPRPKAKSRTAELLEEIL